MELENQKALEMALTRTSAWFQIHADQRLRLMNFYVVLIAALIAAFLTVYRHEMQLLGALIAAAFTIITYSFKHLDRRAAALLKDAEAALTKIEGAIASAAGIQEINLINAAEKKDTNLTYRQAFNLIFGLGYLLALLGLLFALWPWIASSS